MASPPAFSRYLALLGGAVIAAAFLGPGTVTTAARAGASHGYGLLWALLFSTLACLLLQEASARLSALSGRSLGEALRHRFGRGAGARLIPWLMAAAIVLGCAAYEAGNILGGVAGLRLVTALPVWLLTLVSAALAVLLLWRGDTRLVVAVLSTLVAVMGVAFLFTALLLGPSPRAVLNGLLVPRFPAGAGLLVLGLIGTTVVPYNFFLGAGLARGQSLAALRLGLVMAIGLGGLISMAVVVVGSYASGTFSFEAVAAVLADRLGPWASQLFAMGLFAAGFTSAVTAPLAAAITARGLFADGPEDARWQPASPRYRAVWGGVLLCGVIFGVSGVRPIPAILLAQALNGLLLPVVAIFLLLAVNDRRALGADGLNGPVANLALGAVVAVTVLLGVLSVARALVSALGWEQVDQRVVLAVSGLVVVLLAYPVVQGLRRMRGSY